MVWVRMVALRGRRMGSSSGVIHGSGFGTNIIFVVVFRVWICKLNRSMRRRHMITCMRIRRCVRLASSSNAPLHTLRMIASMMIVIRPSF